MHTEVSPGLYVKKFKKYVCGSRYAGPMVPHMQQNYENWNEMKTTNQESKEGSLLIQYTHISGSGELHQCSSSRFRITPVCWTIDSSHLQTYT